jgi:hypothetical protein
MKKHILDSKRLRRVPAHFSWVDHRLIHQRLLSGIECPGWALYLFLLTVGDEQGLSYYSDASVCSHLNLSHEGLRQARRQLLERSLIAWESPLYQVLCVQHSVGKASYCDGGDSHASARVRAVRDSVMDRPAVVTSEQGHINSLRLAEALTEIMKGGKQ